MSCAILSADFARKNPNAVRCCCLRHRRTNNWGIYLFLVDNQNIFINNTHVYITNIHLNPAIMDNFEDEVTREPFEVNQTSNSSISVKYSEKSSSTSPSPASTSSLDSLSSTYEEDAEFARTFGIDLKGFGTRKRQFGDDSETTLSTRQRNKRIKKYKTRRNRARSSNIEIPTSITSDCIYHRGSYLQKGDIVAMKDMDDNCVYFAQLMGFLQNTNCEKSASVCWLVPKRPTSRQEFDPSAYELGVMDERLRKLDCMKFVLRCPHDFYTESKEEDKSFIWTTIKPVRVPSI